MLKKFRSSFSNKNIIWDQSNSPKLVPTVQLLTTSIGLQVDPEKETACQNALKMFLEQGAAAISAAAAGQYDPIPFSNDTNVTERLEEARRTLARTAECKVQRCKFRFEPVHPRRGCKETKGSGKCLVM